MYSGAVLVALPSTAHYNTQVVDCQRLFFYLTEKERESLANSFFYLKLRSENFFVQNVQGIQYTAGIQQKKKGVYPVKPRKIGKKCVLVYRVYSIH